MFATIRDDIWNVLNMQHITPISKRGDYSDIPGGVHKILKNPPTWLKVATILEKPTTPTHLAYGISGSDVECANPEPTWRV